MVFVVMGLSAVLVYFLMKKLPWSFHRKMYIQITASAFLMILLGYFLTLLYAFWVAAVAVMLLLALFSIIFGKQLEYAEKAEVEKRQERTKIAEKEFNKFSLDKKEREENNRFCEDDEKTMKTEEGRFFREATPEYTEDNKVEGSHETKGEPVKSAIFDDEDIEQQEMSYFGSTMRRSFIDEEDEETEAHQEEEAELLSLRRKTEREEEDQKKKADVSEVRETSSFYVSGKRANVLEALEGEKGERD